MCPRSRTGLKVVASKYKYSIVDAGIVLIAEKSQNMVAFPYFISFLMQAIICLIILELFAQLTQILRLFSLMRINHCKGRDIYIAKENTQTYTRIHALTYGCQPKHNFNIYSMALKYEF